MSKDDRGNDVEPSSSTEGAGGTELRREGDSARPDELVAVSEPAERKPAWRFLLRVAVVLLVIVSLVGFSILLFWSSLQHFESWVEKSPEAPGVIEGLETLMDSPALLWALPLGLSLLLVSLSLDLGLTLFRKQLELRELGLGSMMSLLRVAVSGVGAQAIATQLMTSSVVAVLLVQGSVSKAPEPRACLPDEALYAPVRADINEVCGGRREASGLTAEDRRWLGLQLAQVGQKPGPPGEEDGTTLEAVNEVRQGLERFQADLTSFQRSLRLDLEGHDQRVAGLHGDRASEHDKQAAAVRNNYDRMADLAAVLTDQTDLLTESLEQAQMDRRARFVRANVERDGSFLRRVRNTFSAREVADFRNDVLTLCEDGDLRLKYRGICERYEQPLSP